jgi:protease secretion system membrane fusion protein
MRFSAFNQDKTPVIPGLITIVGADKEPGEGGKEGEFYVAQVETTKEGLDLLGNLKVQPGMAVSLVIKAGERSFMSYLLKPLTDKTALAFKN